MKITSSEKKFLEKLKPKAMEIMKRNKLLASITGAQAILESNWGTSELATKANALFGIKANDDWTGPVYSKDTKEYYDDKIDAVEVTALFRAYNNWDESIEDRTLYLLNRRISPDGPFRYDNLVGEFDYRTAADLLQRDGYATDPNYPNKLIAIIEKYELYKWDDAVKTDIQDAGGEMYRVRKSWEDESSQLIAAIDVTNAIKVADENPGYKVFNCEGAVVYDPAQYSEIYRVRLSWDQPNTQICANKNLVYAKKEAQKHEGYKVFDHNGQVVYDPWVKNEPVKDDKPNAKPIILPIPGDSITLNNTAIYRTSNDKIPFIFMSGIYYIYEDKIYNGRIRITRHKDRICICPEHIFGFVNMSDISK